MARNLLDAIRKEDMSNARAIIENETYGCIDSQTAIRDGTALFFCCCRGYLDLAVLLINKNANVNARNKCMATPLHAAADNNHLKIVRLLLEHGGDLDAQTHRGDTPLHLAAFRGHADVAQLLVEHGANYLLVNEANVTAAVQATSQGHKELAQYLNAVKDLNDPSPWLQSALVDIRPPSPCPSPVSNSTQAQSFSLPLYTAVSHPDNSHQTASIPNQLLHESSVQSLPSSLMDPQLTDVIYQPPVPPSHRTRQSSLNPNQTSRMNQKNPSPQEYQQIHENTNSNFQSGFNNQRFQNEDATFCQNTFENSNLTSQSLLLHPSSSPKHLSMPLSTSGSMTTLKTYAQPSNLIIDNLSNITTHNVNISDMNTRKNNSPVNFRPVTRQSAKTAPVFDNSSTDNGYSSLQSMRSREPEESIDNSMTYQLPLTSSVPQCPAKQIIDESRIKQLNNIPQSTSGLWVNEPTNEEESICLSIESEKLKSHQPGSNHSSLMSTGSSHNSVHSNMSYQSGDARRGDFEFLSESIPCFNQRSDSVSDVIHPRSNQHLSFISSNPQQSFKMDSIVPPPSLSRLPSTPCSLDMGHINFDLNSPTSPGLRPITPMSLEPCDSLSGSRFMETSTKQTHSENGAFDSDWVRSHSHRTNISHPGKHDISKFGGGHYNIGQPANVLQQKQDKNTHNRSMKLKIPPHNASRYNLQNSKQFEPIRECNPNSNSSHCNYINQFGARRSPNSSYNDVQIGHNEASHVASEGLNSMDLISVSLNDLSAVKPRKRDNGKFNNMTFNIPMPSCDV